MCRQVLIPALLLATLWCADAADRQTVVEIDADAFRINGRLTYEGVIWRGQKIEGLLLNSRMVQGIFDDRNPQTASKWIYPDTQRWDAERNTREFIAAMPEWHAHGLLAFTINLQGGSPQGYSKEQPWHNSAIESEGTLRADSMVRLASILERADELGMVAILGCFYFGQDQRLRDEAAVIAAVDAICAWLEQHRFTNVLVEINNECNVSYDHAILKPERVHELITRVKSRRFADGRRLLAGTSFGGGTVPTNNIVQASDFILMHGNGVSDPAQIAAMVAKARALPAYRPMPILFNEDDHFEFEKPLNNFTAALSVYASWGYFDPGQSNYIDGYQCPPVNWGINTDRKRAFFRLVREVTSGHRK